MGFLLLIAVAGLIGLACHWMISRIHEKGGAIRFILVSMASSLLTAWVFFLYSYVQMGVVGEPPGVPVFIAILSFPISLVAGFPFVLADRTQLEGRLTRITKASSRHSFLLVIVFWLLITLAALLLGTYLSSVSSPDDELSLSRRTQSGRHSQVGRFHPPILYVVTEVSAGGTRATCLSVKCAYNLRGNVSGVCLEFGDEF